MTEIEVEAELTAEKLLGSKPDQTTLLGFGTGGGESDCFRLRADGQDLFLKMNHRPGESLGVYFHGRLREAGLPVPELVTWEAEAGSRGSACGIWEFVDGTQANFDETPGSCPFDEAQSGDLLRQIHSLECEGPYCFPGDVPPAAHFGPCTEDWLEMFPCAETAASFFDQGCLAKDDADRLCALPEIVAGDFDDVPKRLLHMGYIGNGNLIVERGSRRIMAIVDGAESMIGDPRLELALIDHAFEEGNAGVIHNNSEGFNLEAFRDGYGASHDPRDRIGQFYVLMTLLFERFFFSYVADQRGKHQLDEIRARLRELC